MKAEIENVSSTKKKIKLNVPVNAVEESYKRAYNKVRGKAAIKGFRKGKVPDAILDKYYGGELHMETLNFLVEKTFAEACAEHHIHPVLQPKFDLPELDRKKEFKYSVEVEVKPEIEPKDYLEITIKKKEAKVEKEKVDAELKKIQEGKASLKPSDKKVIEKGLTATIDFLGKVDGVPFKGGDAKGFMLEYGAGRFLKEFEEKMEGMKAGESRQIEITFPADYFEKSLAGKKATFDINLHALHEKDFPPLDDELAKDLGKTSIEEVKKEITDMLTKMKEREFRQEYATEVIEHLLKKNKVDVPEGLLAREMEDGKRKKEEVEKGLKTDFILESIAKKENIKVDPKDLEGRFQQLSMMYRTPVAEVKKHYRDNNLIGQLVFQLGLEKTLDFIIDKAKMS